MSNETSFDRAWGPWVIRWRWPVLVVSLALTLIAGIGARNLAFNNDYRVFFSDENPQLLAFEELQRTYTKIDNIFFAVVPKEGNVFTPEILDAIERLTLDAWQLPYALRVDSITNYQHTTATEDDLIVADLVEGGASFTADELAAVREVALAAPLLRNFAVSGDGAATGVNITFQMPQLRLEEVPEAVAAARALAAQLEADYPVNVHLTGMVMLNNSFFEMSMQDMSTLIPAMYGVILLVSFLIVAIN